MSGARRLDRKRPFGTVHGGDFAHRYEQDGRYFDGDENETVAPTEGQPQGNPASGGPSGQADVVVGAGAASTLPAVSNANIALGAIGAATSLLEKHAEALIAELEDESDDSLRILQAMETAGRKRVTVLRAIEELMAKRAAPPAAPAVAGGAAADGTSADAASQVASQLQT